jgi:hypothetical protein
MNETQKELPLPFPDLSGDMPLLLARTCGRSIPSPIPKPQRPALNRTRGRRIAAA